MEDHSECMLVLIGATPEGKKELIGFQVGVRESAQSWRELLVDGTHPASPPRQARWSAAKRSGSNGGLGLLVRLPIPGKQVGDFVGWVIWKPGQHVSEPDLRIDVVHLAGFDQSIDGGGTMAHDAAQSLRRPVAVRLSKPGIRAWCARDLIGRDVLVRRPPRLPASHREPLLE